MKTFQLVGLALYLLLTIGFAAIPAISASGRGPGLPSTTIPARGLRLEWTFRPSTPLAGSTVNQMPTMVFSSFRNVISGRYLAVQNGALAPASSQSMEFQFEPRVLAKVLEYNQEVAIRTRSGRYLRAARLGSTPVLVLALGRSYEWVVLGGQARTAVPVDVPVALGNVNVRHAELVYCPGTPGRLELNWDVQCPPAPSAGGEQPVGVASPRPLPSVLPTSISIPTQHQWWITEYQASTRHLWNAIPNAIMVTYDPPQPFFWATASERPARCYDVPASEVDCSVFFEPGPGSLPARLPYLLYKVPYALKHRVGDHLCSRRPCYQYFRALAPRVNATGWSSTGQQAGYEWVLIPRQQAGSQVNATQRFAIRNTIVWDFLVACSPLQGYGTRLAQYCP